MIHLHTEDRWIICFVISFAISFSMILLREQLSEIGLNSEKFLGLVHLGIGLIIDSFQILGISEVVSEILKSSIIQGVNEN